ncbi:MAG TPA: pyrroline-5-carboxylate reductase [bacterium]|nr:pyrroline-5-carboxylate reductase [bacterium]
MKKNPSRYRHGFLGAGKMAQALLKGLLKSGLARPQDVLVSRKSKAELARLGRELKVATTADNLELAAGCRWIWLGIKPFQAREVLAEIAPALPKDAVLLSMLAGISCKTLRCCLGAGPGLIRFMPNTPALIGQGMTGVYFDPKVKPATRREALRILQALGETLEVKNEARLDAVTGLSGSGPAFVYYLADALAEGGRQAGLKIHEARRLAYQTLRGAIGLLQSTGLTPEELIAQVVSKGGTTEAGLKVLSKSKVAESISRAVARASRRATEIKEQNECSR